MRFLLASGSCLSQAEPHVYPFQCKGHDSRKNLNKPAQLLREALPHLLGRATPGAMAFIRCLPPDVCRLLSPKSVEVIDGWFILQVTSPASPSEGRIGADQAVEMREGKTHAVLLLVDTVSAGAGMDGIYSAAREIPEAELFDCLSQVARQAIKRQFDRHRLEFAEDALDRAKRLGSRRQPISPWRSFSFLARCASDEPNSVDIGLAELGLWPVGTSDAGYDPQVLETSGRMVERLLLPPSTSQMPAVRVAGLLLPSEARSERERLQEILRQHATAPVSVVLRQILEHQELWVGRLRPGFAQQQVHRIELVPWHGSTGKLSKWSGLSQPEGIELPALILPPESDQPSQSAKLEVRWKVSPDDLPKGVAVYEAEVRTDTDVLASRSVEHAGKAVEKLAFADEDFEDFEENSRFEAWVVVRVAGTDVECRSSEFLIYRGERPQDRRISSGKIERCLVDAAIELEQEVFDRICSDQARKNSQIYHADSRGYVVLHPPGHGRPFRVPRPEVLCTMEQQWFGQPEVVPRWRVQVRDDGSPSGVPELIDVVRGGVAEPVWERLVQRSRILCQGLAPDCGLLGRLYHPEDQAADQYVLAWQGVLEAGEPQHALAHTVEVQNLTGRVVGLLVLPSHPMRLAWQMAYDALAWHLRYVLKRRAGEVREALAALDSSYVPSFLPGLERGQTFVFGDTLGLTAIAMVRDDDHEPRGTIAMLAAALGGVRADLAPTVGNKTAEVLGQEVTSYLDLHREVLGNVLDIHAIRAGDGSVVARALGKALREKQEGTDEGSLVLRPKGFRLNLFPASQSLLSGRFLAELTERRRAGAGELREDERWVLEPLACGGTRHLPRLQWSRRREDQPQMPAHIAMAFDTFDTQVESEEPGTTESPSPVYGLSVLPDRQFLIDHGIPTWRFSLPSKSVGKPHPVARRYSDRLQRLQAALLRLVAHNLASPDMWPVLVTRLDPAKRDRLRALHTICDWVITVDRNAGVEFFDSPKDVPDAYDAYIIDAVPERDDLGCLQLLTSTCNLDEVRTLLDLALGQMGLSNSLRNCQFLLVQLKALSGRLAIRLACPVGVEYARNSGELLALAMTRSQCELAAAEDPVWLPLCDGFFVPLDDVTDLLPPAAREANDPDNALARRRADLLYVSLRGNRLAFRFIEIKYRRHLRDARARTLAEAVVEQVKGAREIWEDWFFPASACGPISAIRRTRLGRVLRFYLDKALRHHLPEIAFLRLRKQVDALLSDPEGQEIAILANPVDRAYVFCPEYLEHAPLSMAEGADEPVSVYLFGPACLPDCSMTRQTDLTIDTEPADVPVDVPPDGPAPELPVPAPPAMKVAGISPAGGQTAVAAAAPVASQETMPPITPNEAGVTLGHLAHSDEELTWTVSTRGNPHLLMVGLPGMGKTTCLGQLCRQLQSQGITPIVLSFHEDIDQQVAVPGMPVHCFSCPDIGFNPMELPRGGRFAHIESAGALRDIFSAVFPDLGELQLEELRQAIKQVYERYGWGTEEKPGATPPFDAFVTTLKSQKGTNKGLLARLEELSNFRFFNPSGTASSLLSFAEPLVLQVHAQQNEAVQNAYASFVLYRIYQDMLRRGPSGRITHMVIMDEAHRASRLKLLPTMAKESRKYGVAMVLASQEAHDFSPSLFSAVANYLVLRVLDQDARIIARNVVPSDQERRVRDRIVRLPKYEALFFTESRRQPQHVQLSP